MDAKFENVKVLETASGTKKDGTSWFRAVFADMEKASRLTIWTDAAGFSIAKGHLNQFVDVTVHDCQQEGFRFRFGERLTVTPAKSNAKTA
jgi:hypothetical protein